MDDATVVYENEDATVVANPKPEKAKNHLMSLKKVLSQNLALRKSLNWG